MREYNFRNLTASDLFPICNLIKKIGVAEIKSTFSPDKIRNIMKQDKENATMNVGIDIFIDIANIIVSNIGACEQDLYKILASVSDMSVDEIKKLSMADFVGMIIAFIKNPDFADFFKEVSSFLK